MIFFLAGYQVSFFEVDRKLRITTHTSVVLIVLLINALFLGYYYFQHWKIALVQAAKLEKEKALTQKYLAQLQFVNLQNQLNPHFLFNSITSLNSLIFENQQLASDFLKQLAKVYRYVLQHKEKELVALQTELTFIQSYLSLLKTRFGEAFRYQIDIDDAALQKQIPPVTLQILIENAIKHNVMTLESPLCVEIKSEEDYLKVRNNLQKKSIVAASNKIGLENLKSLYGFLTSENIEIIENHASFIIKLPLI
ncbi:MAG: histidine kinase [Microscillaceae bacterium]|nr:histidine kinase [Microscillaceae bacterium]